MRIIEMRIIESKLLLLHKRSKEIYELTERGIKCGTVDAGIASSADAACFIGQLVTFGAST